MTQAAREAATALRVSVAASDFGVLGFVPPGTGFVPAALQPAAGLS